jgi:lipid-A-disaccharide synthase
MSTAAIDTRPIGSTHGIALSDTAITIGIVAGEASGDALAATLIQAVRARLPQARFVGIAGPKMVAAGCAAWHPLETLRCAVSPKW